MNIIFIIVLVYAGLLMASGVFWYKKNQQGSDLLLANRSLNYWVTAIAAHASDMSAWLFMGFPAAIYTQGMPGAWIAVGLIGGMFLTWHFIATKLRIATEHYNTLTLASFFEQRFNDSTHSIRIVSSLVTILFFTVYIAAGLTGMGKVFQNIFSIDYHVGIAIGLGSAIVYLLIGGFSARAWNDFFQGIFLLIVIMIVPVTAFFYIGGWPALNSAAQLKNIPLSFIPSLSKETFLELINGIIWGVGYFGMPHILINFMALDDVSTMKKAQYIGMTWQCLTLISAIGVGLVSIAYFTQPLANPELIFIVLVQKLFSPLFAGIILCAILAATITTIDTQILVVAGTLSHDLGRFWFKNSSSTWLFRVSILLVSGCSYLIAAQNNATVMGLVSYAWSGLASAFSPLTIAALYTTKTTRAAALASILVGAATSALWPLYDTTLLPLIPGACASTLALYIGTLLTSK